MSRTLSTFGDISPQEPLPLLKAGCRSPALTGFAVRILSNPPPPNFLLSRSYVEKAGVKALNESPLFKNTLLRNRDAMEIIDGPLPLILPNFKQNPAYH